MEKMFWDANAFNQPLNNWNTSSVINMESMFFHADIFNQNINDWDVSNVENMFAMFDNAYDFNQPLDKWDVSNVKSMRRMFDAVKLSTKNYDDMLIAWSSLPLQNNVVLDARSVSFCNSQQERNKIINDFGWIINDGGLDCSTLSVNEELLSHIKLYPNPTNNNLFLDISNDAFIEKLVLYNANGKEIKSFRFSNNIDLSQVSSGLYLLKMISDKGVFFKKIIKR